MPKKLLAGVYINSGALPDSVPFAGWLRISKVISLDSGSEPVRVNTICVSSLVVMVSGSAIGCSLVTARKISARAGVPSFARVSANEVKATAPPLLLIDGSILLASAVCVSEVVLPVIRSSTRMSRTLLVSSNARLLASEEKATNRPSALIDGVRLQLSPPAVSSCVVSVIRS